MDLKPKNGMGYTAILPWDENTRAFVKQLRSGMPKDRKLRIRGRGPMSARNGDRSYCRLEDATHVALYFDREKINDLENIKDNLTRRYDEVRKLADDYKMQRDAYLDGLTRERERCTVLMLENDDLQQRLARATSMLHAMVEEVVS